MNDYLISYCFYLLLILGLLIGFGFLFHRLVLSGWNRFGRIFGCAVFYPRFIGTPVHEIGHLIFAFLTGSRITKVKLFPVIDRQNRTCGGAHVSFSPRTGLAGSFSLFLSGIGPMLFCPLTIMILMYFLTPQLYYGIIHVAGNTSVTEGGNLLHIILNVLSGFFGSFRVSMLASWKFWLFLFLAIPIANECVLSGADIKSAGKGAFILLFVLIFIGGILCFFPSAGILVAAGLERTAAMLVSVLCLALVFNLIHWLSALILGILF